MTESFFAHNLNLSCRDTFCVTIAKQVANFLPKLSPGALATKLLIQTISML